MKTRIYCYEKNWKNEIPLVLYFFHKDVAVRNDSNPAPQNLLDSIINMSTGLRSFLVDGCLHEAIKEHFLICSECLLERVSAVEIQIDLAKSQTPAEWAEHIAARFYQNGREEDKDVGILICGMSDK